MTDYPITNTNVLNCYVYGTSNVNLIAPSGTYDTTTCSSTGTSTPASAVYIEVSSAVVGNGIQGNKLTVTPIGKGASVWADSDNAIHCATVTNTINGTVQTAVDIDTLDDMPTDIIGQYSSVIQFKNPSNTSGVSASSNTYVVTPERGALYYKRNGKWEKQLAV